MTLLGARHDAREARSPTSSGAAASAGAATGLSSAVSGAWRPRDGPGDRRFAQVGPLRLESGAVLDEVSIAYETWGALDADGGNAVLVLHALTGDSHVRGPAGPAHPSPGWWETLIGPGLPIDTDRYFVIAPNVLGGCQGSTGPSSPRSGAPGARAWGSDFPRLTIRDQVQAERALRDQLGIQHWALVIGGSMGGMRAVEWAATHPDEVERLVVIAASARASADQIAWNSAQIASIRADAGFHGGDYHDHPSGRGPEQGLGVARRIAHTTYRTAEELASRFSNHPQDGEDPFTGSGRHQVTSYLDHHAGKLARRFDANSYLVLAQAMNTHDVGRGRGGVATALRGIGARSLIVAIDSDRLFPPALVAEMAEHIPDARWEVAASPIGHDAFLVAHPDLDKWISELMGG